MTLPSGWELICVDELAGPKGIVCDGDWVESKDQDATGQVRLTQLADVGEGVFRDRSARYMTEEAAERLNCTYLAKGDILIARMPDPIGRACMFPGLHAPAVTAVDVMVWRTDGSLARADWFMGALNSPYIRAQMGAEAGGTTRQRIAGGRVKILELPTPPLAEQGRIVAKIQNLVSRIARARSELARAPDAVQQMKQRALSICFASEPDRAPIRLGTILKGIQAGKNLRCEERPPHPGELGVVKVSAVTWGRFDPAKAKTLPPDYIPPEAARIRAGDLLMSRANTIELVGAVALVERAPRDLFLSDKVLRLVVPEDTKRWVQWFLRSPSGREQIERMATGNQLSMRNLSQDALRRIELPFPNAATRLSAVHELEAAFARADRIQSEAARATKFLDRLKASILAKAFQGELVPQDPADEPVAALLDRIRAERAAAPNPKRGRRAAASGP